MSMSRKKDNSSGSDNFKIYTMGKIPTIIAIMLLCGCSSMKHYGVFQCDNGNDYVSEGLPDTIVPSISIIYYSAGWSVGPSVDKQYAYRFAEDSTYAVNWELNDLIELVRNDPDAPGGMASRHIEGDWYIELWYDK